MLDLLISLFAPHDCLACHKEGSLFCGECLPLLPAVPPRCYRCHALSPEGRTCVRCRKTSALHSVQAATLYREAAKELVWRLKFQHARAATGPMTRLLQQRTVLDEDALLVPVPTATSRVRQRGFDQATLLARRLAVSTRLPTRSWLARRGQARQVGSGRKARLEHLSGAFWVSRPELVAGKHVILIDDVLTTGATLEAAAAILRRAGAVRVDAIVFAQA